MEGPSSHLPFGISIYKTWSGLQRCWKPETLDFVVGARLYSWSLWRNGSLPSKQNIWIGSGIYIWRYCCIFSFSCVFSCWFINDRLRSWLQNRQRSRKVKDKLIKAWCLEMEILEQSHNWTSEKKNWYGKYKSGIGRGKVMINGGLFMVLLFAWAHLI